MLFRQLFDATTGSYTYLLAGGASRKAVLIDAVKEHVPQYLQLLKELDLELAVALDTHVHDDHMTGSGLLRHKTGCDIIMGEHSKAQYLTRKLRDQEFLDVDGLRIQALYTPGHTDDSYCYVEADRVFTGDALLIRSTGRTDFQNGSSAAAYHSLFNCILNLPDETFVYPAHDYCGMTVSTIGEEKRHNPRLQVKNSKEYIEMMSKLNMPKPQIINIAVPANLQCGLQEEKKGHN